MTGSCVLVRPGAWPHGAPQLVGVAPKHCIAPACMHASHHAAAAAPVVCARCCLRKHATCIMACAGTAACTVKHGNAASVALLGMQLPHHSSIRYWGRRHVTSAEAGSPPCATGCCSSPPSATGRRSSHACATSCSTRVGRAPPAAADGRFQRAIGSRGHHCCSTSAAGCADQQCVCRGRHDRLARTAVVDIGGVPMPAVAHLSWFFKSQRAVLALHGCWFDRASQVGLQFNALVGDTSRWCPDADYRRVCTAPQVQLLWVARVHSFVTGEDPGALQHARCRHIKCRCGDSLRCNVRCPRLWPHR